MINKQIAILEHIKDYNALLSVIYGKKSALQVVAEKYYFSVVKQLLK